MMTDELNHHNDPTWLLHSVRSATGDKPYLGDLSVIDGIVRQFVAGILERFEKVGHGIMTPLDAANMDKAECTRLGELFCGADATYEPVRGWTDGGLAGYVRGRMNETVSPDEPNASVLAQAFAQLAHTVYGVIGSSAAEDGLERHQSALEDAIRSLTWLLIGAESNE